MLTWIKEVGFNDKLYLEYNFCSKEMLLNVIKAKEMFEKLDLKLFCSARARANPFESIRSVFFMNRAAIKMANIDAVTDFMFTNIDLNTFHKDHCEPYYFADVCAGPGGFTEYILWRKKWRFKGFGLTLRNENDFKLTDSCCVSPTTFLPLYGITDDGNVCCPDNIHDFKEKVLHETGNEGVHFVMSDGGFSVEGNENFQEILSKNIYICQCLIALEILREHGHFVTKMFDTFTCFSVGLIYLIYHCFEKISILKPNSSRPANAERYLICSNLKSKGNISKIRDHLRCIVKRLWEQKNNKEIDIKEIVPLSLIKNDNDFYNYIYETNNRLATKQTLYLKKILAFYRNPTLISYNQEELRQQCLTLWKIPDKPKIPVARYSADDVLSETVNEKDVLLIQPRQINTFQDLTDNITNLDEWSCALLHCKKIPNICNFYAGTEFSKVYRLQCNRWARVKNLQLSKGTLLYGELVKEQYTSDDSQVSSKYSLHVIDALRLGDLSLAELTFSQRMELIGKFCKAVNHEFRKNAIRVRPKNIIRLSSYSSNVEIIKNDLAISYTASLPVLGYKVKNEFYEVNSILLLKTCEAQSFHLTYVLRIQMFGDECEGTLFSSFDTLLDIIKDKQVIHSAVQNLCT